MNSWANQRGMPNPALRAVGALLIVGGLGAIVYYSGMMLQGSYDCSGTSLLSALACVADIMRYHNMGGDSLLWFGLMLLVGGIVCLYLGRRGGTIAPPPPPPPQDLIQCPNCQFQNPNSEYYCKNCNMPLGSVGLGGATSRGQDLTKHYRDKRRQKQQQSS